MREQLTIPPKVLQEYLEAARIHGFSEKEAKDLVEEKYLDRWEKDSLFPSIAYQVQKAIEAAYVLNNDWRQRERKKVLESLYEQYILGEGVESDPPVIEASLSQEPDNDKPRILHDLSPDDRFNEIREFLENLEIYEGKLVWPNKKNHDKAEQVRKFDLALLLYYLNMKEGIQPDLTDWASYGATCFVWQDYSSVSNAYLLNKYDRYNDYVEHLSDGKITRMIKALYV